MTKQLKNVYVFFINMAFSIDLGGKWTTYRSMAEQTINKAIEVCNLKPASGCRTKGLLIDGAHGWSPTMFIRLVQDFGLENEVGQ